MADKTIGSLPAIESLDDTSLIPAEQQGVAVKVTGAQFKGFAQAAVGQYVTQAQAAAQDAESSAESAEQSVAQIGTAVEDTLANKSAAQAAQEAAEQAEADAKGFSESAQGYASQASESASEAAGSATSAQGFATDALGHSEDAKGFASAASTSATAAEQSAAQATTKAGEAASSASEAAGSATTAGNHASDAEESAGLAQGYASDAQAAKEAIENLGVAGETLQAGQSVQVEKTVSTSGVVTLTFKIPQGPQGVGISNVAMNENGNLVITLDTQQAFDVGRVKGDPGSSVVRSERISGNGSPGTTDVWALYNQDDEQVGTYTVYNGMDGTGAGDMTKDVYDPTGKNQDIFAYVDQKVASLKEEILGMNFFVVQGDE